MVKNASSFTPTLKANIWTIVLAPLALLIIMIFYVSSIYVRSPASIRTPKLAHYHFRLQVLIDGQPENFADAKYQMAYAKNVCNGELTAEPFHFHDNKDQIVHIHWEGMTGGELLRYYGWDVIGGLPDTLGYHFNGLKMKRVPTAGDLLPDLSEGARFYIFSGDETGFKERELEEFLRIDLKNFLAPTLSQKAEAPTGGGWLEWLLPTAYAHGGVNDGHPEGTSESEEDRLSRINSLVGNVVIFVQKERPTDEQVVARFELLEPLSESACGG